MNGQVFMIAITALDQSELITQARTTETLDQRPGLPNEATC